MGELIVLFKSSGELAQDWQANNAQVRAELAKSTREEILVEAVLEGKTEVLAKASASEIAIAKSEAARIESEFLGDLSLYKARRLLDCMKRDQDRQAEHSRLAKRSERFLRRIGAV